MKTVSLLPTADAIDAKGLQSRSLRGQRTVIDARLPEDLKGALQVLLRHHNDQSGLCCPGQELIAAKLGVTDNTVRARLRKLEKRGLVTIHRMGRWTHYTIHFQAIDALEPAVVPVDNSLGTLNLRDRHPQIAAPTPVNHGADTLKIYGLTGKGTGYSTEGGTDASAGDAVDKATFPPLPIFEDLKTEQPGNAVDDALASIAEARAEGLPLGGHDIRDLIEAAAACGEVPRAVTADALRFCLPAFDAPAPTEAAALATPAEPVVAPIVTPPAPAQPAPALAVAIAPATLAAVNAQRVRNGKTALKPADLQDLHREATLAGIAPQAAAEYILAKPIRTFLLARHYRPEPSAATPTGPVELTAAGRAAQAQIARALAAPAAVAAAPAAAAFIVASPSARPISGATVTPRHRAPVSVGAATGTGWARTAVERFTAGQPVSHATIAHAASALCLSLADLKAQRATALARVAA